MIDPPHKSDRKPRNLPLPGFEHLIGVDDKISENDPEEDIKELPQPHPKQMILHGWEEFISDTDCHQLDISHADIPVSTNFRAIS